jgi:hypothetical protein
MNPSPIPLHIIKSCMPKNSCILGQSRNAFVYERITETLKRKTMLVWCQLELGFPILFTLSTYSTILFIHRWHLSFVLLTYLLSLNVLANSKNNPLITSLSLSSISSLLTESSGSPFAFSIIYVFHLSLIRSPPFKAFHSWGPSGSILATRYC